MKNVTIDFYGKEANYLLLEDVEDVMEYAETLQINVGIAAQRMIKSNLKPEQFDHLVTKDGPGGLINSAYHAAWFRGTSVLLELGFSADSKIQRLLGHAAQGEQIMINSIGGYCFRTPETKILRESPYVATITSNHVINENTKFINLENDSELEKHTIKHLEEVDPNYSYVLNLRSYEQADLIKVFKEFKANGGEAAYLYTTGFDVNQIHDYCDALHAAGINKIDFEFNSGIPEELQRALDIISKKMDINVKEA